MRAFFRIFPLGVTALGLFHTAPFYAQTIDEIYTEHPRLFLGTQRLRLLRAASASGAPPAGSSLKR